MRIGLDAVSKRYGDRAVVDRATLDVRSGEFFALLGPSGSGKSTILSMIAGLTRPDSGRILLDNEVANDRPPRERKVGMVFQDLALWPHMTVRQHLTFVAPQDDPGPLLQNLELFDRAGAKPSTLSGGEAQRLAIARALAVKPRFLLLDEPLGPLDRRLKEHLLGVIEKAHRLAQATSIFVTHDYEEAFRLADRIGVILNGRIAQVGTPQEMYRTPATEEIARLTGPVSAWQEDGKRVWARPEQIELKPDPQGRGVARRARFLGGRWEIEIDLAGQTLRAYSADRLSGPVSLNIV